MDAIENAAFARHVRTLDVQPSTTAQPSWAMRGFKVIREEFFGEERAIVMTKGISGVR